MKKKSSLKSTSRKGKRSSKAGKTAKKSKRLKKVEEGASRKNISSKAHSKASSSRNKIEGASSPSNGKRKGKRKKIQSPSGAISKGARVNGVRNGGAKKGKKVKRNKKRIRPLINELKRRKATGVLFHILTFLSHETLGSEVFRFSASPKEYFVPKVITISTSAPKLQFPPMRFKSKRKGMKYHEERRKERVKKEMKEWKDHTQKISPNIVVYEILPFVPLYVMERRTYFGIGSEEERTNINPGKKSILSLYGYFRNDPRRHLRNVFSSIVLKNVAPLSLRCLKKVNRVKLDGVGFKKQEGKKFWFPSLVCLDMVDTIVEQIPFYCPMLQELRLQKSKGCIFSSEKTYSSLQYLHVVNSEPLELFSGKLLTEKEFPNLKNFNQYEFFKRGPFETSIPKLIKVHAPGLSVLSIANIGLSMDSEELYREIENVQFFNVKNLDHWAWSRFEKLRVLNISSNNDIEDVFFSNYSFNVLQDLELISCPKITGENWDINDSLQHLRVLHVEKCSNFKDALFIEMVNLRCLSTIYIDSSHLVTGKNWKINCEKLEKLVIKHCKAFTDDLFQENEFSNLRHLELIEVFINGRGWNFLNNLKLIKMVNSRNDFVDVEFFQRPPFPPTVDLSPTTLNSRNLMKLVSQRVNMSVSKNTDGIVIKSPLKSFTDCFYCSKIIQRFNFRTLVQCTIDVMCVKFMNLNTLVELEIIGINDTYRENFGYYDGLAKLEKLRRDLKELAQLNSFYRKFFSFKFVNLKKILFSDCLQIDSSGWIDEGLPKLEYLSFFRSNTKQIVDDKRLKLVYDKNNVQTLFNNLHSSQIKELVLNDQNTKPFVWCDSSDSWKSLKSLYVLQRYSKCDDVLFQKCTFHNLSSLCLYRCEISDVKLSGLLTNKLKSVFFKRVKVGDYFFSKNSFKNLVELGIEKCEKLTFRKKWKLMSKLRVLILQDNSLMSDVFFEKNSFKSLFLLQICGCSPLQVKGMNWQPFPKLRVFSTPRGRTFKFNKNLLPKDCLKTDELITDRYIYKFRKDVDPEKKEFWVDHKFLSKLCFY